MIDSIENSINRGKEAQRVLAEPVLVEAFDALERSYRDDWAMSTPGKVEADLRELLFLKVQMLREIKDELTKFVTDGHMSEQKLRRAKL